MDKSKCSVVVVSHNIESDCAMSMMNSNPLFYNYNARIMGAPYLVRYILQCEFLRDMIILHFYRISRRAFNGCIRTQKISANKNFTNI